MSAPHHPQEFLVDPASLAPGRWCHTRDRQIAEGRVRSPFKWKNAIWVSLGGASRGNHCAAQAYRIIERKFSDGATIIYYENARLRAAARGGSEGLYIFVPQCDG